METEVPAHPSPPLQPPSPPTNDPPSPLSSPSSSPSTLPPPPPVSLSTTWKDGKVRKEEVGGKAGGTFLLSNLPYMGELTFGDGRPRRGRKPKKADICHLIAKNYGVRFPTTYVHQPNSRLHTSSLPTLGQDRKSVGREPGAVQAWQTLLPLNLLVDSVVRLPPTSSPHDPEPLNLCLRDRTDPLQPTNPFLVKPESSPVLGGRKPCETGSGESGPSGGRRRGGGRRGMSREEGGGRLCSAAAAAAVAASNSAQVSICKFKFTGGLRPCLREKKMLSVDAGGNFRFFSDKPCVPTVPTAPDPPLLPLPKSAKSMSMCMMPALAAAATFTATTPSALSDGNDVMRWEQHHSSRPPHLPGTEGGTEGRTEGWSGPSPSSSGSSSSSEPESSKSGRRPRRRRRTRKSLMREGLERRFKEEGFLIQTQQRESAEGATYCKFRQLRKFTRYLFRSWKDYLPHGVGGKREEGTETGWSGTGARAHSPPTDTDSD